MRIIAFDPGGTTGVAIYETDPVIENETWERKSLGPHEHHYELWQLLLTEGPFDHVIYETFLYQRREITKGVSLELISREYIGIIKLAEQRHANEIKNLVDQSPSIGKDSPNVFWNDAKLRKLGLWVSSEHERDATRHLLYFLTFTLNDRTFVDKLH